MLYIGQNCTANPNRVIIDTLSTNTLNLALIFRQMREVERQVPNRPAGRMAVVLRNTFYIPTINALLPSVMRRDDRFRMFSDLNTATEWIHQDD